MSLAISPAVNQLLFSTNINADNSDVSLDDRVSNVGLMTILGGAVGILQFTVFTMAIYQIIKKTHEDQDTTNAFLLSWILGPISSFFAVYNMCKSFN